MTLMIVLHAALFIAIVLLVTQAILMIIDLIEQGYLDD